MFKIYTKHTMEVGETVFEHFAFTVKVASKMIISSVFFLIHGLSGGLLGMPERYNLCAMAESLCDANDDRIQRQEENNNNEKDDPS